MKIPMHTLSVIFVVLLSSCSASSQKIATPTVALVPPAVSTKTPIEPVSSPTATVTVVIQTPTKDYNSLLSQVLPSCGNVELSPSQTWATGFCNDDETW